MFQFIHQNYYSKETETQIGKTENLIGYQMWKPNSIFYENRKLNARKMEKSANVNAHQSQKNDSEVFLA